MKTQKIYYKEPYKKALRAKVIEIDKEGLILDRTIAYPEGGGQESDRGVIVKEGVEVEFFDVQKRPGRTIFLEDFPTISVDNKIVHFIKEEELEKFSVGDEVLVRIDTIRRAKLSISHSAIHIVLMAIEKLFSGLESKIYGAKIKEDSARLDFRTTIKFSSNDISEIEKIANDIVVNNWPIEVFAHKKEPEALYWRLDWYTCPCGGTHIDNTSYIKYIKIKRKNLGKSAQRISATFEYNNLFQERFYE